MNRIILSVLSLLLASSTIASAQSLGTASRPGFRFDILGGAGMLIGEEAPGQDINRPTLHVTATPSVVFGNAQHALGLMFTYRYNRLYHSSLYDDCWHTFFIGPQYTWVALPYDKSSFFWDIAMGGVMFKEILSMNSFSTSENLSGFGMDIGMGARIRTGENTHCIIRLSMLASTLDPNWGYDASLNASSVNLSVGFSFGK